MEFTNESRTLIVISLSERFSKQVDKSDLQFNTLRRQIGRSRARQEINMNGHVYANRAIV